MVHCAIVSHDITCIDDKTGAVIVLPPNWKGVIDENCWTQSYTFTYKNKSNGAKMLLEIEFQDDDTLNLILSQNFVEEIGISNFTKNQIEEDEFVNK